MVESKFAEIEWAPAPSWPEPDGAHIIHLAGIEGPDTKHLPDGAVNPPYALTVVSWAPTDLVRWNRIGNLQAHINFDGRGPKAMTGQERERVAEELRLLARVLIAMPEGA